MVSTKSSSVPSSVPAVPANALNTLGRHFPPEVLEAYARFELTRNAADADTVIGVDLLGVVDSNQSGLVSQDYGRRDHRPGQAAAADLIRAGDAPKTKIAEVTLDRRHFGDARQLREKGVDDCFGSGPLSLCASLRCGRLYRGDP